MTDFIDGSYEAADQERFVAESRSGFNGAPNLRVTAPAFFTALHCVA